MPDLLNRLCASRGRLAVSGTALFFLGLLQPGCAIPTDLPPPPQLNAPGTISGQLLEALPGTSELMPAAGANVQILATSLATVSGSDGRFLLKSVTQTTGKLLIQADRDTSGTYRRQRLFDLATIGAGPGQQVSLGNVELDENAAVSGKVLLSDQLAATSGLGGTTVFVPEGPFTAYTSDDGSFILDNLPSGQITLTVFRAGYQAQTVGAVNLSPGQVLQLTQTVLDPVSAQAATTGAISGQVIFIPPVSDPQTTQLLAMGAGAETPLTVKSDGTYSAILPVGIYTLVFSYPGYAVLKVPNVLAIAGMTSTVPLTVMTPATPGTDAGFVAPFDAGPGASDAGPGDAGPGSLDAGLPLDAGPQPGDAGSGFDAGTDAGASPADAGSGFDAGTDAGSSPVDAGAPDAGPPPVARIVTIDLTGVGQMLRLDGTESQAPGAAWPGIFLSYAWTQTSGPDVLSSFSDNDSQAAGAPTFTAPATPGTLGFTLTVTDVRSGLSAQASTTVTVLPLPVALLADSSLVVPPGQIVTFDGSGSTDPNGYTVSLRYHWTSALEIGPATGSSITFQAPSEPGDYTVTLEVSDPYAYSLPVTGELHVVNVDGGSGDGGSTGTDGGTAPLDAGVFSTPPTARIASPGAVAVGGTLTLDGTLSQAAGQPPGRYLSYRWSQTAGDAVTFSANNSVLAGQATFTAPETAETLDFTLTVTDTITGLSAQASTSVLVINPPVAVITPVLLQAYAGSTVRFDGSMSVDSYGMPLTYAWSSPSLTIGAATGSSVAFTAPMTTGAYSVSLVVSDQYASSAPVAATLQVVSSGVGPSVTPGADQLVPAGTLVQLSATASSPDTIAWSWTQTAGTEVVLNDETTATPSFTAPFAAGTLTFQVTATTAHGTASASTNVLVQLVPPTVSTPATQTVQIGTSVQLVATGSAPNPITWSWAQTAGPPVTLTGAASSTAMFTAPLTSTGLHFKVTATTGAGSSSATTTVTVVDTMPPMIIASDPPANSGEGPSYAATATFNVPLDPASVTSANAFLSDTSGTVVSSRVLYDTTTSTLKVVPAVPLPPGGQYTLHIGAVQDLAPVPNVHPTETFPFSVRPRTWTRWSVPSFTWSGYPVVPGVAANDDNALVYAWDWGLGPCANGSSAAIYSLASGGTTTLAGCDGVDAWSPAEGHRGFSANGALYSVQNTESHYGSFVFFSKWSAAGGFTDLGFNSGTIGFTDGQQLSALYLGSGIMFQFFDPGGTPEVVANSSTNWQAYAGAAGDGRIVVAGRSDPTGEIFAFERTGAATWTQLNGPNPDSSIATALVWNRAAIRGGFAAGAPVFIWAGSTGTTSLELTGAVCDSTVTPPQWRMLGQLDSPDAPVSSQSSGAWGVDYDLQTRGNVAYLAYATNTGLLQLEQIDLTQLSAPVITSIAGPGGSSLNTSPSCAASHPEIAFTNTSVYVVWRESCSTGTAGVQIVQVE
jgi:hypothetical protein